ncbi:MAG: hypothetical protein AAFO82_08260 [Bacteroidota bacterium]
MDSKEFQWIELVRPMQYFDLQEFYKVNLLQNIINILCIVGVLGVIFE